MLSKVEDGGVFGTLRRTLMASREQIHFYTHQPTLLVCERRLVQFIPHARPSKVASGSIDSSAQG